MQVGGGVILLVRVMKLGGGGATSKLVLKTLHLLEFAAFRRFRSLNMNG